MAKIDKKNTESPLPQGSEGKKSKTNGLLFGILAFAVATLIMLAVLGGAFYFVIHNNINGLADKYRPSIQKMPILKLALPKPLNPEDDKFMTEDEVRKKYRELLNTRDELKVSLDAANKTIEELQKQKGENEKLKAESEQIKKDAEEQKKQVEERSKELDALKKNIDELVARGDKAGFAQYYDNVDKGVAEKVRADYEKQKIVNEELKNFAKTYESMDAAAAAKIFEKMGNSKVDSIAEILKNTKKDVTAEILAAMDPAFAAKVTDKLKQSYVKIN